MSLASRITRAPRPFDPDRGDEALAALPCSGATRDLIHGTASSSPYLHGLILKHADWLSDTLSRDPDAALADALAAISVLEDGHLSSGLRQIKGRVALLVALADLGGVWTLEQVTGALTSLADTAVQRTLTLLVTRELERGKLPGQGMDQADTAAGMVILAMGKTGAGELNYSSDIDLICLFDDDRYGDDYGEARAAFIRVTRRLAAVLSEPTGEGYVFRTDLRLRPDPSVTPVCISMDAAERYYESLGRTWERAAFIKARVMAGDRQAGCSFLDRLAPFVWRRHLDFAAIEDAHDIRKRIRSNRRRVIDGLDGRNIKLDPGGIREIEFFTQTRQLIAGGRDLSLRVRGTVAGLHRLTAAGWVTSDTAEQLAQDYTAHRTTEHRLQMIADAQTHSLPATREAWDRLAALSGTDADTLQADLSKRVARVAELTEGFFAPATRAQSDPQPEPAFGPEMEAVLNRWPRYPALRSPRAAQIFDRLRPHLLERLAKTDDPERALHHLDGFLAGLPAGVQVFSLFEANPQLLDFLLDIASAAPGLAEYLARNAQVFDAVIGGDFFDPWPGVDRLDADLSGVLFTESDYESRLDAARRWHKEWHFRIGVHHLRGLVDPVEAAGQYADLAEAVLRALWPVVVAEVARRFGEPPGQGAAVLAMGSLGAGLLTSASDLDVIVIYDAPGDAESSGPRTLPARSYYARVTQALITALSAPTAEGRLYEVDMRLRPSGKQGPVATSLAAFATYQQTEAWTWEHLALTRARPVAGAPDVGARIAEVRNTVLRRPHDAKAIKADVAEMRRRIAEARSAPTSEVDLKDGPGRLQDIDLIAAMVGLLANCTAQAPNDQINAGIAAGVISAIDAAILIETQSLLRCLRLASALVFADKPKALGPAQQRFLAHAGITSPDQLAARLKSAADAAAGVIGRLLES